MTFEAGRFGAAPKTEMTRAERDARIELLFRSYSVNGPSREHPILSRELLDTMADRAEESMRAGLAPHAAITDAIRSVSMIAPKHAQYEAFFCKLYGCEDDLPHDARFEALRHDLIQERSRAVRPARAARNQIHDEAPPTPSADVDATTPYGPDGPFWIK